MATETEKIKFHPNWMRFMYAVTAVAAGVFAFYRPSTWKCLDCGYEGAFILEDSSLAEKVRKRYQERKQG